MSFLRMHDPLWIHACILPQFGASSNLRTAVALCCTAPCPRPEFACLSQELQALGAHIGPSAASTLTAGGPKSTPERTRRKKLRKVRKLNFPTAEGRREAFKVPLSSSYMPPD